MLDLNDFYLFVQVVQHGGFTAAGRSLRVPKATVSHRIQQLESGLGVRLLHRTSRTVGVTDAGADFYRHAVAMLHQADLAETIVRVRLAEPMGTVRCTASAATMQFAMARLIAEFLTKNPKVNVVAHASDRTVDLNGENYDIAVRAHTGPLPDSNLVQRPLASAPWYLFAGASYLDAHGTPTTPEGLQGHASLFMMRHEPAPAWHLSRATDEDFVLPLAPMLFADDMASLQQAAILGLGIVALPSYTCREAVRSGQLRRVLPEWRAGDSTITALVARREGLLPSVRAFLDHLASDFPNAVLL